LPLELSESGLSAPGLESEVAETSLKPMSKPQ